MQQVRGGNPTPDPCPPPSTDPPPTPPPPPDSFCVHQGNQRLRFRTSLPLLLFMCYQPALTPPCGPVNLTSDPITRREVSVLTRQVVWRGSSDPSDPRLLKPSFISEEEQRFTWQSLCLSVLDLKSWRHDALMASCQLAPTGCCCVIHQ